jgi:hypothetical protein
LGDNPAFVHAGLNGPLVEGAIVEFLSCGGVGVDLLFGVVAASHQGAGFDVA